jgi:hypothetical protein
MKRSRLSERKFREVLRAFYADIIAKDTATLTGIGHCTIRYLVPEVKS